MNEAVTLNYATFTLPPQIVSSVDLSHLVRDAEQLDDELTTAKVRAKAGAEKGPELKVPELLSGFLVHNQIKLKNSQECAQLVEQLRLLKEKAPVLHMTFAVTADRESRERLVQWLRSSVHPQAVIAVGVQPGLVAGVYLRTPNRVLDLSLRSRLAASRAILTKDLELLRVGR